MAALSTFADAAAEGSLLTAAIDAYKSGAGAAAGGAIAGHTSAVPTPGLSLVRNLQKALCCMDDEAWQQFMQREAEVFDGWDGVIGAESADEAEESDEIELGSEGWMEGVDDEDGVPTAADPVQLLRPRRAAADQCKQKLKIVAMVSKDARFAAI